MGFTRIGAGIELAGNVAGNIAGLSTTGVGRVGAIDIKNVDFTTRFDPDIFKVSLPRPTKTIVVRQDPAPGDFVPAGTPITVVLVEKGLIPTKSLNGLAAEVVQRFPSIGNLEDDLNRPDDSAAKNAKAVLDKGIPFDQLADADKATLGAYTANRLPGTDAAKAAQDIMLLYGL